MKQLCQKCGCVTDTPFCSNCVPPHYSIVVFPEKVIFVGFISLFKAIYYFILGKQIIRWWMGSDVLYLLIYPPGRGKLSMFLNRVKANLSKPFISEHWVDSASLRAELSLVYAGRGKKISVEHHTSNHLEKYGRISHDSFNVAYYRPNDSVYQRWLYGADIIEKLKIIYPHYNWICLDGSANMSEIFPVLDLYIRPNRHDGHSRLKTECEFNEIPVVATRYFEPDLDFICKRIDYEFDKALKHGEPDRVMQPPCKGIAYQAWMPERKVA